MQTQSRGIGVGVGVGAAGPFGPGLKLEWISNFKCWLLSNGKLQLCAGKQGDAMSPMLLLTSNYVLHIFF